MYFFPVPIYGVGMQLKTIQNKMAANTNFEQEFNQLQGLLATNFYTVFSAGK